MAEKGKTSPEPPKLNNSTGQEINEGLQGLPQTETPVTPTVFTKKETQVDKEHREAAEALKKRNNPLVRE